MRDAFGAAYAADEAQSLDLSPAMGGWLQNVEPGSLAFNDQGLLNAFFPDVFTTLLDGEPELFYDSGEIAAVRSNKSILFGFALDSLLSAQARADILSTWLVQAIEIAPPGPRPDGGMMVPDQGMVPDKDAGDAGVPEVDQGMVTPDQGQGTAGPDAGDGLGRKPGEYPVTNRCGCTTHGRSPVSSGWLALLGLLLFVRRRVL